MSEAANHSTDFTEETISADISTELPSKLRTRQKLGMISSSRTFDHAASSLIRMGGQSVHPTDLIASLEDTYRDDPRNTSRALPESALHQVPKIIDHLIDDGEAKAIAHEKWGEAVLKQEAIENVASLLNQWPNDMLDN